MRPVAIHKEPPMMPHTCIKCGAHAQIRDWFVDTGTEVEWEGIVYFCNFCFADMVKVTPDFLSVESHREIVAEYTKSMDELSELKIQLRVITDQWFELTGLDLMTFFQNLKKVDEHARGLELSRALSSATGDMPTVSSDSSEPEHDDSGIDEPDPTIEPAIIVFS